MEQERSTEYIYDAGLNPENAARRSLFEMYVGGLIL